MINDDGSMTYLRVAYESLAPMDRDSKPIFENHQAHEHR
jgi:hypothetical protein